LVMNRLPVVFHHLGAPRLKNIARPVHVFLVELVKSRSVDTTNYP